MLSAYNDQCRYLLSLVYVTYHDRCSLFVIQVIQLCVWVLPGETVSREAVAHTGSASHVHRSSRSEEDSRRETASIYTVRASPKRRDGSNSGHRGNIGESGRGRTYNCRSIVCKTAWDGVDHNGRRGLFG